MYYSRLRQSSQSLKQYHKYLLIIYLFTRLTQVGRAPFGVESWLRPQRQSRPDVHVSSPPLLRPFKEHRQASSLNLPLH